MAGTKEIRTKIKSVQNTRKITKAMEMVAASKMRKAQERMRQARPYGEKIRDIAAHLAHANPEYRHPFLVKREIEDNIGAIVVTSDKGLCGALNTNVLRLVVGKAKEVQDRGFKIQFTAIGNKALGFLQRTRANVVSHLVQVGDTPNLDKLVGPIKVQVDAYREGKINALYVVYTRFINTMKQEPVIEQILPLPPTRLAPDSRAVRKNWDYVYEPDAKEVLDQLLTPLPRGDHLPGARREHRERAVGAHGRHEGGQRQRVERDRRPHARLQQGAPGGDHQGIVRNRRRRCRRLNAFTGRRP